MKQLSELIFHKQMQSTTSGVEKEKIKMLIHSNNIVKLQGGETTNVNTTESDQSRKRMKTDHKVLLKEARSNQTSGLLNENELSNEGCGYSDDGESEEENDEKSTVNNSNNTFSSISSLNSNSNLKLSTLESPSNFSDALTNNNNIISSTSANNAAYSKKPPYSYVTLIGKTYLYI